MRFTARALIDRASIPSTDPGLARAQHAVRRRPGAATASSGRCLLCRDGPVVTYAGAVAHLLSERER